MRVSKKTVAHLCAACVVMIVFSAAAYFPGIISVSVSAADDNSDGNTLQYRQSCDMCLPPDTEKSGSNSQIFERQISAADLVRANTVLPVSAGLVSEFDYLMYTVRITDTSIYGYDLRCGTVMRC